MFKKFKSFNCNQRRGANGRIMSNLQIAEADFPIDSHLIEYRNSSIAGVGVFARAPIGRRVSIIEYKGEFIRTEEEYLNRERSYRGARHNKSTYFFQLQNNAGYIDATVVGNAARYLNHSCSPNCIAEENFDGKIFLISAKAIAPNDELTLDYGLHEPRIRCKCKSDSCRGHM